MTTIINTPSGQPAESNNSSMGIFIIITLVILAILFFFIGMPLLRSAMHSNAQPVINVPDKLNVTVNKSTQP